MSKAAKGGATAVKGSSALESDESLKKEEKCPVCKAGRYLNANITFLLNPECYHKMCSSCVDRLFSSGPHPCPIAGCGRTLRKNKFRPQTFEDTFIEREVDIRKEVARVFNKVESDFEDLRSYNDYLGEVEDITYNLVNKIDVDFNRAKLKKYADANSKEIAENAARQKSANLTQSQRLQAEQEAARQRRAADHLEEERERAAVLAGKRSIIDQLASSDSSKSAEEIAAQGRAVLLKRRGPTSSALPSRGGKPTTSTGNVKSEPSEADDTFKIAGLKRAPAPPQPATPYSPFGGWRIKRTVPIPIPFTPSAPAKPSTTSTSSIHGYEAPWLSKFASEDKYTAGGYVVSEYYNRVFTEAFAGLSVFVEEEVAGRTLEGLGMGGGEEVATQGAASVAGKGLNRSVVKEVEMDDIF